MWVASYTFSMPLEEREIFLQCYRSALFELMNESELVAEIHLLDILTVVDETAASLSLQVLFDSEENYLTFSETIFPIALKLLNVPLAGKFGYFHTLLKRV